MKVRRFVDGIIHIELSGAEARVFLDELLDVRGGTRLPKIRQVCTKLQASLDLCVRVRSNVTNSGTGKDSKETHGAKVKAGRERARARGTALNS